MNYSDPKLWFTWKGRVNRRLYFFGGLAVTCITEGQQLVPDNQQILILPLLLVALYSAICLGIKRCHDRGRSGWFMLVNVVPILCLWPIIELLFFKGDTGPNAYGPDPLQPEAIAPTPGGFTLPTA
ncbi:MAG: DUF805 domain-containing protein [Elusimicrobia bacterium]|nr:DUF805 domain-containing protein [Elusimicrobiota bacterium]